MLHIQVPATTANMGPGFDSIGMAFKLYNNVWVKRLPDGNPKVVFTIKRNPELTVPTDETNLIYQTIVRFYKELDIKDRIPPIEITQEDYIPSTRGLGSSAACIVAGLYAANWLSGVGLTKDELANLATLIEGHPDNVAPAIFGGIVIGVMAGQRLEYIKLDNPGLKRLKFAVMIPDFPLSTEKARGILPDNIKMKDGIFNASRTALMTAALLTGDFDKLRVAMDDCFHQPYRARILPDMEEIFGAAKGFGCKGIFLSGAGPTIIAAVTEDDFNNKMGQYLSGLKDKWSISFIEPDFDGTKACNV